MKQFFILITAGAIALAAGCGKSTPTTPNQSQQTTDYLPLVFGNYWQYNSMYPLRVDSTVTLGDGLEAHRVIFTLDTAYWRKSDGTVTVHTASGATNMVLLKQPLEVGKTWCSSSGPGYTDTIAVVATMTMFVPAGTFSECFQIEHRHYAGSGLQLLEEDWLAPNVGIIRMIQNNFTDTLVLTSYDLH